jgi:hypothetical protein
MKEPWTVFLNFWKALAHLGQLTQEFLHDVAWAASPAAFYRWVVKVITFCQDYQVPTFDQPSWLVMKEVLAKKAMDLEGTAINASLTQVMRDWRDFDYEEVPPPNRFKPYAGPYYVVVEGYDKISTFLRYAASRLFSYEENRDVDFAGRTVTNYEAADIIWYVTRKMCDDPMFQMRDPLVPKWFMPFPWLEYCEQDLRQLKDFLRKQSVGGDTLPDPSTVPWSMPGQ